MSGGSHQYVYCDLEYKALGKMYDPELNALIRDLIPVLKAVEWWRSGDWSAEGYREEVEKFKKTWMHGKSKRRADLIRKECDRLKEQLLVSFGDKPFDPKNDPWEHEEANYE